jgi:hypothetical protein
LAKTRRLDLNITRKPRGLFIKHHTFFLLRFRTEDTGGAGDLHCEGPERGGKKEEVEGISQTCSPGWRRDGKAAVGGKQRRHSDGRFAAGRSDTASAWRGRVRGDHGLARGRTTAANRRGGALHRAVGGRTARARDKGGGDVLGRARGDLIAP